MRDVRWATQSCYLGFEVVGIWPSDFDGTDINAVCRSHSNQVLASADDFGQVNLFRYPTCQLKVFFTVYSQVGHLTEHKVFKRFIIAIILIVFYSEKS